jgi:1-acyl-sn-glycerol-3-phosphate acyltransferase
VVGYDAWWKVAVAIFKPLLRLGYRWRFAGLEFLPAEGPAILASNHISVVDPFGIALAATRRHRAVRYLGAAEFFDRAFTGFVLRRLRQIRIRRGAHDLLALEEARRALANKELVGIFPEGRVGDGSSLLRGHTGAARLALASRVPVIPVGIWGTQRRWPRSGLRFNLPLRPRATVVLGEPIAPSGDPTSPEDVHRLTDLVMAAVQRLVATELREDTEGGHGLD